MAAIRTSPATSLAGKKTDPGVTNIRKVKSPHWRRWLGVESRCIIPFTSFAEHEGLPGGSRPPVWFAFDDCRPLAFFAGIWTRWTSVRKVREGETTNDLGALSRDEPSHDHRRWRRLQWFTSAALEVVAATTRRRNRPDHSGLPLSAGHFQVEQDRASHVLLHHPELARHASRQPLRRNRADRQYHDEKRAFDQLRTRSQHLSQRHKGLRCGNGEPQHNS